MLRPYQQQLKQAIYDAWGREHRNVICTGGTGMGKTVLMGNIIKDLDVPTCAIAHRNELVGQISLALNREEVPHGIVAPPAVVREVVRAHMETHGKSFYNSRSPVRVAGVNTVVAREATDRWFDSVRLVIVDEAHHLQRENVWGRAVEMFPHARLLGLTAHALRGDGKGLGRCATGVFDELVIGPCARDLIDQGYLSDYRIACPPSDIDLAAVPTSPATGDFNPKALSAATHASRSIVGDVVKHYQKFAAGKLGLTFSVDIAAAKEIQVAYQAAGIRAEVLTGETPTFVRAQLLRRFRAREILQLVSCDILGEGTDIPAVEVISMVRGTASFQLYGQQFGRGLRPIIDDADVWHRWDTFTAAERKAHIAASRKPHCMLIDHVGNVLRHGLPCVPRSYTLDSREKRAKKTDDAPKFRVCLQVMCMLPYPREMSACPQCGTPIPLPAQRSKPEFVEGDLLELDSAVLEQMRNAARTALDVPSGVSQLPAAAQAGFKARHREKIAAQMDLRSAIATWAGWKLQHGRLDEHEAYRLFWITFGYDVLTAQTLNHADSEQLQARIAAELAAHNVQVAE